MKRLCILASVSLLFSASVVAAELTAEVPKGDPEFIAKAISAAPADIGKDATIIRLADGFNPTTVREGKNGWTCAIDLDGGPWCADAVGVEWFKAVYTQGEPPDKTGFVYMLAGDMGTSNHDPYATDKSHWVKTGPHVMIVGKAAHEMAASYPNQVDPDPTHRRVSAGRGGCPRSLTDLSRKGWLPRAHDGCPSKSDRLGMEEPGVRVEDTTGADRSAYRNMERTHPS